MSNFELTPIAYIRTPYKQKFAIPRQPGLVKQAKGVIELESEFADINGFRGIEQFSHLWLIFQFHHNAQKGWSPLIRPPRMGGNKKQGVFASRSTFRPNALGMSVVEFAGIKQQGANTLLTVVGVDLLDKTPIFDIKPYLPYSDAIPSADAGFAQQTPVMNTEVAFTHSAKQALALLSNEYPELEQFVINVLKQDPRPSYKKDNEVQVYGMSLYDLNIKWQINNGQCQVLSIEPSEQK